MKTKLPRSLRHHRQTLILLILALVAFGLLVAFAPLTNIDFWAIDLYTFRAAAKAMQLGADPYDEPNIVAYAGRVEVGNIHNYIYAPYFAFALRPLVWVSPQVASRLWFALNLGLYVGSIVLLLKAIHWQPSGSGFLLAMLGLILFPPLRTTLTIGQSTVLVLFFFALALFLLKRDTPARNPAAGVETGGTPPTPPGLRRIFRKAAPARNPAAGVETGGTPPTPPGLRHVTDTQRAQIIKIRNTQYALRNVVRIACSVAQRVQNNAINIGGYPFWGGITFSLGLFKPHLAPVLLYFGLLRHGRFILGVLTGLAVLTIPFWSWLDNWLVSAINTREANLSYEECFQMVSATSLARCTISPNLPSIAILPAGVLIAAIVMGIDLARSSAKADTSPKGPAFDRYLSIFIVLNGLIVDHTRIADQLLFVFPLLVIWRDWQFLSAGRVKRVAPGLLLAIYILPYSLDFFQARAIVYQLPFWYIGISLALLMLLLLYNIPGTVTREATP